MKLRFKLDVEILDGKLCYADLRMRNMNTRKSVSLGGFIGNVSQEMGITRLLDLVQSKIKDAKTNRM